MIRYQIGTLTANAKASGGSVSFYNGKTIHTFTSTGTFVVDNNGGNPLSIDYVWLLVVLEEVREIMQVVVVLGNM